MGAYISFADEILERDERESRKRYVSIKKERDWKDYPPSLVKKPGATAGLGSGMIFLISFSAKQKSCGFSLGYTTNSMLIILFSLRQ
jgi:hypothetical protein